MRTWRQTPSYLPQKGAGRSDSRSEYERVGVSVGRHFEAERNLDPHPNPPPFRGRERPECAASPSRPNLRNAALLALGALAVFLQPVRAQAPQEGRFELAMCNLSGVPSIFVALAHRREAQQWQVEGWYAVPDWGCVLIGSFLRDTVYVYGETREGTVWKAIETDRSGRLECVDHKKWFYAVAASRDCAGGQTRVRFRMLQIAPDKDRLTWSITGST
jgi:uncharacterized membrane protein